MPDFETQKDLELYLASVPPCDCGQCLGCLARGYYFNSKGNLTMSLSKNESVAERFVDGPDLLKTWNRDRDTREEFENDFEAFCFYKQAIAAGTVRSHGRKIV